ncbi:MAG: type II toxin-antitoxin system HicB family antitoxin [Opitutales bacterium]|nr:type II toxin-antitoxin system HicB family antitoxin [Opitutales bacterium]
MKIKAVIHSAEEGGFWAEIPALPGCCTQGETMEEIEENLREAIALWLEAGEPEDSASDKDRIIEVAV